MELIAQLSDDILDEIKDAKKYAKQALRLQYKYPAIARGAYKRATEELGHMDEIHKDVTSLIAQVREEKGEPTEEMMREYERRHGCAMDMAAEVYGILGRFKG